jgi:hypothetical protein
LAVNYQIERGDVAMEPGDFVLEFTRFGMYGQ